MENDIYEDISLEKEKAKLETQKDEIKEKDNNIDAIFESSQKAFTIKEENTKDENINKYFILETVMPIIQRYGIYQDIIMEISKLENTIKEFESLQQSQKEITVDKIELEKELIVINVIKSIVEALKPPTIINLKRKIIDMLIFSILKDNKSHFTLNQDYSPNKNFLDKVLEKLDTYEKKSGVSQKEKEEIEQKKKYINDLIK